jgi:hypothetical protein
MDFFSNTERQYLLESGNWWFVIPIHFVSQSTMSGAKGWRRIGCEENGSLPVPNMTANENQHRIELQRLKQLGAEQWASSGTARPSLGLSNGDRQVRFSGTRDLSCP